MMDLQVAIFLLIFLSLSSLATIGICFVEIRSCWRQYRLRVETQRLRKLNIIVEEGDHELVVGAADQNGDKECNNAVLEAALEPASALIAAEQNSHQHPYVTHMNHVDQHGDLDLENNHDMMDHSAEQAYHGLYHQHPRSHEVFAPHHHQLIYASHHFPRGMGAFV